MHTECITVALLNGIIMIDHEALEQKGDPDAKLEFAVIVSLNLHTQASVALHTPKMRFGQPDHKWTMLNTGVNGV